MTRLGLRVSASTRRGAFSCASAATQTPTAAACFLELQLMRQVLAKANESCWRPRPLRRELWRTILLSGSLSPAESGRRPFALRRRLDSRRRALQDGSWAISSPSSDRPLCGTTPHFGRYTDTPRDHDRMIHGNERFRKGSFLEAFGWPTDSGFPFPTSTPTPRKFCFGRKSFEFYKNTTFSRTNASKFSVHGAGVALASTMMSTSIPPIPKPSKSYLAISSAAPSLFEDSSTTRRATTFSINPNQKIEKPSSSTRSSSSPGFSSTFCGGQPFEEAPQHLIPSKQPECGRFPSPTNIPSCTTATTPDDEENMPERIDPQPSTTSSTPPGAKPFVDDGPT